MLILEKMITYMINHWFSDDISCDEEKQMYEYGLYKIVGLMITVVVCFIISLILDRVVGGMVFLLSFLIIRTYTGGYHASTPLRCLSIFAVLFTGMMLLTEYLNIFSLQIIIVGSLFGAFTCFLFAPINHPNLHLTLKEKKCLRLKARVLSATILGGIGVCLAMGWVIPVCLSISLALFVNAVLMILGKVLKQNLE